MSAASACITETLMIRFASLVTFALSGIALAQQPDAPKPLDPAPAAQAAPQASKSAKEQVRALGSEEIGRAHV